MDRITFQLNGMSVAVAPFTWDWLGIGIDGDASLAHAGMLAARLRG